jgi:signal transduction histidine kinase
MLESIVICSTIFLFILIYSLYSILKLYDKKSKEYLLDMDNIKLTHDKNLLTTQIEIQEQTFENISREIHDNIGQKLSLIKLNLNTLSPNQQGKDFEKINLSANLISTVISDLRDISKSLGSDNILANGLVKAIEAEVLQLSNSGKYEIALNVYGEQVFLDSKKELILYRIIQEAINNILKHADATKIFIDIHFEEKILMIKIRDDGPGFISDQNNNGAGLKNMQRRVSIIDGKIEIISNAGTAIIVKIPL